MEESRRRILELEQEIKHLRAELVERDERERDEEEGRTAMLYMLEDLNEITDAIERNRNQWETTFDSIPDPIFIHDRDMRLIRTNRAYMQAAGEAFPKIIGKFYYEVFPIMEAPFQQCLDTLDGIEAEHGLEVTVEGVGAVFQVKSFPITDERGKSYNTVHIMENITEDKRNKERSKTLLDISQRLIKNIDIEYRFKETCDGIVKLGYDTVSLGFMNENEKVVQPKGSGGSGGELVSKLLLHYDDTPLGENAASEAISSGRPRVQNNLRGESTIAPLRDLAEKGDLGSMAAFPLKHTDIVLGVICVYHTGEEFPKEDIDFIEAFTNQTSTYIRNSQLFDDIRESERRVKEEMELTENLLILSRASFATTDMDRLLNRVAECSIKILNADSSMIYLWDKDRGCYSPGQSSGLPPELQPVFKSSILAAKDVVIDGLSSEPFVRAGAGAFPLIPEIKTAFIIPLASSDRVLGINVIGFLKERGITSREKLLMEGMSSQISVALNEAQLYRESITNSMELSRRVETIQVLYEIDRAILSTLDINEILETAARMAVRLIACDEVFVGLADNKRKAFRHAAGFGVDTVSKGEYINYSDSSAHEVMRSRVPEYVADRSKVQDLLPFEQRLLDNGLLSAIRVPLVVKEVAMGFVGVGARRPAAFTPEDLSTIEKLAGQMAIGLQNAQLLTDLDELFIGTISSLSEAIDAKSRWTAGHSSRVTEMALTIGNEFGLDKDDMRNLEIAAHLHDVGKIGTFEGILDKPGKLTPEEVKIMQQHPIKGAEILAHIKQLEDVLPSIRGHQECYDGSGYPDALKGEDIPFFARIIAVADTVDAMGADRPYRSGLPMNIILSEIKNCSGTQFDPDCANAFLRAYDKGLILHDGELPVDSVAGGAPR